ncbi:MAG: hypothetical protein ABI539_08755 [Acidobacteriota bacterium]
MVNDMAFGGTATGLGHYEGHHGSATEQAKKIGFDENSRISGLGVLIDSRIGFTFTGDGFIVTPDHRELLDKANIRYEVL